MHTPSRNLLAILGLLLLPLPLPAAETLREHVAFLAADKLEGRLTGSAGERRAADYIAGQLKGIGATPLAGLDDFRIPFEFTAGTADRGTSLRARVGEARAKRFKGERRVRALSFSENGSASAPVVFAGYGISVPAGQEPPYDSYAGLDVRDKIVLVLRYFPEDTDEELRGTLSRYSGLRYKALAARERGARALVVFAGPRSPNAGETVRMSFDAAVSGSGVLAASVDGEVAAWMLDHAGRGSVEEIQRSLDTGNPHVGGFAIPELEIDLDVRLAREQRRGQNVVALLPGTGDGPVVVLGAHYDHLGRGRHGNSLARREEQGLVHAGADDNASGVAALIEIGGRLARRTDRAGVVLAFWSGEELGLLGSTHFLDAQLDPERISAYVNLDMVGRVRDNRLHLQGAGSSSTWRRLIERANVPVGFDIRTQDDPYLPTDALAFYQKGVPVLSLFSGSHEDYHRPSDRPELLDYDEMSRVVDFGARLAQLLVRLDEPPDYVEVERSTRPGGDRDSLRIFTGTIPDYTTEVAGLLLSGVVRGGPAEQAGLQGGDVIVEFAGQKITNIYDYTHALDSARVGQAVRVVFLREGERMEVRVTPTARP